jgi:hypothetical protein
LVETTRWIPGAVELALSQQGFAQVTHVLLDPSTLASSYLVQISTRTSQARQTGKWPPIRTSSFSLHSAHDTSSNGLV